MKIQKKKKSNSLKCNKISSCANRKKVSLQCTNPPGDNFNAEGLSNVTKALQVTNVVRLIHARPNKNLGAKTFLVTGAVQQGTVRCT